MRARDQAAVREHFLFELAGVSDLQLPRFLRSLFRKPDNGIDHRLKVPVPEHHGAVAEAAHARAVRGAELRPDDEPAEGVLVAWGITLEGRKVLLGLQLGSRESYEDWLDFGRDLKARGMRSPALIVADGNGRDVSRFTIDLAGMR